MESKDGAKHASERTGRKNCVLGLVGYSYQTGDGHKRTEISAGGQGKPNDRAALQFHRHAGQKVRGRARVMKVSLRENIPMDQKAE